MSNPSPFLFEQDFRKPRFGDVAHCAALREAEERGFAQGVEEGRRQMQGEVQARLASAAQRIAEASAQLLSRADARQAELEDEALAFAVALGRKLAGEALDAQPLGVIGSAARAAFQQMRGVPHLAVRVNDALVEEVDALIQKVARECGFEGRLVVLGEPEIALGDVRFEWADGGVTRERARIDDALAQTFSASAGTSSTGFDP